MKYYIIAGEASGDLHASNLVKALKQKDASANFRGWGGDMLKAEGVELVEHYRNTSFMGFVEVIKNLRTIFRFLAECKRDILNYKPDALILVDYPGFNLRIAEFAKQQNLKVFYYISPQIWAWKEGRVKKIKRDVDKMFVILPFEKDFYKKHNYEVEFVGHPLLDAIKSFSNTKNFVEENNLSDKKIVALLPGSRAQEIKKMLEPMKEVAQHFPDYQFVIAGVNSVEKNIYEEELRGTELKVVFNQTYQLLQNSSAAIVTSGTATLETALFGVPQMVCYKGNSISYFIGKQLVKVIYISLVNLIMDKEVVRELIQQNMNVENMKTELKKLLSDENYRSLILNEYKLLQNSLGGSGASEKTAEAIFKSIQ